jgi:serine/threonine protein phosphatase PrpC
MSQMSETSENPEVSQADIKLRYAAATDVGMKRSHNEDCFTVVEEEQLFIVCDGMGGHASGEVASKLACKTVGEFFVRTREEEITWPYRIDTRMSYVENRLSCGIRLANLRVYEDAMANPSRRGMGTTIVAAVASGDRLFFAHVGDSRAYLVRGNSMRQITRDHSLLEEMKAVSPDMTEEQERAFPHKNVITRALGMREAVQVDLHAETVQPGDRFILCSDGLSGMVENETLSARVRSAKDLTALVAELIALANQAGGMDNVTALVIERPPEG